LQSFTSFLAYVHVSIVQTVVRE